VTGSYLERHRLTDARENRIMTVGSRVQHTDVVDMENHKSRAYRVCIIPAVHCGLRESGDHVQRSSACMIEILGPPCASPGMTLLHFHDGDA
jgi:hypothetical protein